MNHSATRTPIPDTRALVEAVRARSTTPRGLHGQAHWRRVANAGRALLSETPGSDPLVVFLFALFHDSMRLNDRYDPNHGERGADLACELHDEGLYYATDSQMDLLERACDRHDSGSTSTDPTVGVCFDADRLQLWRCGIRPNPELLSTKAARDPERIKWARRAMRGAYGWEGLARDFGF